MLTILSIRGYRFFFFSMEGNEPPHIHVRRDRQLVKFSLQPVSLSKNRGFKDHELNDILQLVETYEQQLLETWHDYFDA